jgi:hypothetical protein
MVFHPVNATTDRIRKTDAQVTAKGLPRGGSKPKQYNSSA